MRLLSQHPSPVRCLAYAPDGTLFASGCDKQLCLWNLTTGEQLLEREVADSTRAVEFSPDGSALASAGWDNRLDIRSLSSISPRQTNIDLSDTEHGFWALAYAPDGFSLVASDNSGGVRLYSVKNRKKPPVTLTKHSRVVQALAFSPKGRYVASASHAGDIALTDSDWGQRKTHWTAHTDWICSLAFSPDGETLASSGEQGHLALWNAESGKLEARWKGDSHRITQIRFLPDGESLLSSGWDGIVHKWDRNLRAVVSWDWGICQVNALAVSPDGMTAAVGGQDGSIVLFDLD